MHELSLAMALVEQVERVRDREKADAVVSVTVDIGALSGVSRESFEFAFPIAVEGTALAGAMLMVEETPVGVTCDDCGLQSQPDKVNLLCAKCGSSRIQITAGRDFFVKEVQLRFDDDRAGADSKKGE